MGSRRIFNPKDLNINVLQSPEWYRVDCLPKHMKIDITDKINAHIDWLSPKDNLQRATNGFSPKV